MPRMGRHDWRALWMDADGVEWCKEFTTERDAVAPLIKARTLWNVEIIAVGVLLAIVAFVLGRLRDAGLAKRIGEEVPKRDDSDNR